MQLDLGQALIWSSRPGTVSARPRRLAAIMFTDMVGYSALAQADEGTALAVLERHNRVLRPVFAKFRGREVKTVGDAFLVEFESALNAAQCAIEIQRLLHDYNASSAESWKIRIRIGIHVGDVVESDGDVLGDAVNIASRIEPLADPEGICLTQQVYDQVQNKISTPVLRLPPTELKNIHAPVTVYKVVQPWAIRPPEAQPAETPGGRHLAVLPLANISPDPSDGYFADGLTEEMISVLSQVQGLSVIARTSVMPYKSAPKSIAQVGAELSVDSVLEGSVRKAGNRIRITLQLVDVATQRHIWANSYNREIDDVFAVQTDIAERTAEALRLELAHGGPRGERRTPTENAEAYDLYLHGLVASSGMPLRDIEEAVRCFEKATQLDPTFAEAYAAWGNLYVVAAADFLPMREVMPRARELAARAIELDPQSSDAHATLANIALQFDHNWPVAEAEFEKAIALNPSNAIAHGFYGLLLMSQGRFDEAKEVFRRETRLDPAGAGHAKLVWAEIDSGNFDVALRELKDSEENDPNFPGIHTSLGMYYWIVGRRSEARAEAEAPFTATSEDARFDHALLHAVVGRPEEARAILSEWERGESKVYLAASYAAMLYANVGEKGKALDLLERDYREGDRVLWLWFRSLAYDSIRDDPRFVALLREYGVPTDPPRRGTPSGPG